MSEVPKSDTGIHATADATNPFAPIDYTSRLKAPPGTQAPFTPCSRSSPDSCMAPPTG